MLEIDSKGDAAKLAELRLAELFPSPVCIVSSASVPAPLILPELESELLVGMSPARRRSFVLGRHCARTALAKLGVVSNGIGMGESRQPLWPEGTVGSISHCDNLAIAAAALRLQYVSLGLDIERMSILEPQVVSLVCRQEEREALGLRDGPGKSAELVLFSIKESIYKCLWPLLERYIDFQDIGVVLHADYSGFSARSYSARVPLELVNTIEGRYRFSESLIVSAAWIQA